MSDLIGVVIGAVVGGLVSYWLAQQQFMLRIDEATRADRLTLYKTLWRYTGLLPKYPVDATVTNAQLEHLSECFKNWYFGLPDTTQCPPDSGFPVLVDGNPPQAREVGGIYLSERSRAVYFDAQKTLLSLYAQTTSETPGRPAADDPLKPEDYAEARQKLSRLRTQLAKDIGSRRAPGSGGLTDEAESS